MSQCSLLSSVAIALALVISAPAREWVSAEGKKIEAEFVDLIGETVHMKKGSKTYKVPLDKLSEPDQEFAKEAVAERAKKAEAARTGPLTFAGQAVERGKMNRITLDLSAENQEIAKSGGKGWSSKGIMSSHHAWVKPLTVGHAATQADVVIGIPAKFDPTLPTQPVFVQWTTTDLKANVNGAGAYWNACNENNWILIAVDAKPNIPAAWCTPVFYANIKETFEQLHQA